MTENSSSPDSQEIILLMSKLKVVSQIQENQKLATLSNHIDDLSLLTSIRRQWNNESRDTTYHYLVRLFNEGFETLSALRKTREPTYKTLREKLYANMRDARMAINKLKVTYSEDINFCTQLEAFGTYLDACFTALPSD